MRAFLFTQTGIAMDFRSVIQSQYLASLAMLKQAVIKCPPEAWDNPQDNDRFWFVAYHALRFAHQYLKANEKGYPRWEQRSHSNQGKPFSKDEILERLALVERDVVEQIPIMDLDGQTGATGALANKFELQLYNIRHIQQHTGELYQRLSPYNLKLEWASQRYNFGPKEKRK
jgi:hypothetical protein